MHDKKSKAIQIISIILCLSILAGVSASDINTDRESNKDTMASESECMQDGNGILDNDKTNRTQNSGTAKYAELPGNSGNNTGNSADALSESSVRDVVRAQFIAEAYTSDDKPAVSSVWPSIFGAIQLIDSVWILNGFRYDSGAPRTHTLFGGRYIENLHVNGKIFNAESVSN